MNKIYLILVVVIILIALFYYYYKQKEAYGPFLPLDDLTKADDVRIALRRKKLGI